MTNFQFNSELFNQDTFLTGTLAQDDVVFNGYSLMSYLTGGLGLVVQTANYFDLSNIDIAQFISEQIDGGGVEQKKYGNRTLNLTLFLQGSSYSDLVTRIEALKQKTRGVESTLDVRVNGTVRTYVATVSNVVFPRFNMGQEFIDGISIDFLITSPQWSAKIPVNETTTGLTGSFEKVILNQGTYETFPLFYFVMASSGNTISAINIASKDIGATSAFNVTLTTPITNNDVVIFDYNQKIVTVNGVEVPWTGFMTPMTDGYHVYTVTITGTASFNNYVIYNPVYL